MNNNPAQGQAMSSKAVAYTLLFTGAAMPIASAVARWQDPSLADLLLVSSFAFIAAAIGLTFKRVRERE